MTTLNVQGQSNLNDVSANNLYLTGNLINNNILNNYRILSIPSDNLSSGAVFLICISDGGDNECVGKFYYQRSSGHDGSGFVDIVISSRSSQGDIPHGFCSYQTDQETSNSTTPHRFSLITGIFSGINYVGLKYEGSDEFPFSEAYFDGLWKSTGTNTPFEMKVSSSVTSQTHLPIGYSELSLQNKRLVINNGNVGINEINPTATLDVGGTLNVSGNTTIDGNTITNGTLSIKAATTTSISHSIPVFTTSPSNTTQIIVTRTPTEFLYDISGVGISGDQTIGGTKTFSSTIVGSISGNAETVTNGVYTSGDQTIGGTKTFSGELNVQTYNIKSKIDIIEDRIIYAVPIGCIMMWFGTTIPRDWVICNGSNGTPNLINKFLRGSATAGATGGADSVTLTTTNIPLHNHTFSGTTTNNPGDHTHWMDFMPTDDRNLTGTGGAGQEYGLVSDAGNYDQQAVRSNPGKNTTAAGAHSHTYSGTTSNTGSGTSFSILPSYYSIIYIMYKGP